MRCYCCNKILTPQQATRKFLESQSYTDMCDECLITIDVEVEDGNADSDEEAEDDSSE